MLKYNKIYNSDCRTVLTTLLPESINCVVSDIPYGISQESWDVLHKNTNSALLGSSPAQEKIGKIFKTRGKPLNGWSKSDKNISKEYYDWCLSWSNILFKVLKPGSPVFLFTGRRYAHRAICALEDSGFIFKDMLAWDKGKAAHRAQHISIVYEKRKDYDNANKWSGWKLGNLRPVFEPILWFMKPYKIGGTIADNVIKYSLGVYNENIFSKYNQLPNNYISFKSLSEDTGLHPTQKPLHLMKFLIELVTIKNQVILDPFCGSGTTLVAAIQLQRKYIGIEINNLYYNIACQRIKNTIKTRNLFL